MKIMSIEEIYSLFLKHPAICTDSRKAEKYGIFFSLKGDNFNGNAFAEIALENGCKYAFIDEAVYYKDNRYIIVENALNTLQELAKHHRSKLKIPVIGITGTNGKTTTKELIKAVLEKKFNTLATEGNLNNHIGVPQTILKITGKTEIAIIEMGANHIGEIAELCKISKPDHGIITNIGKAHLEGFGSFEGIVKAKKELYDHIEQNNGLLFVNKDNQLLSEMASRIKKITYGKSASADHTGSIKNTEPFIEIVWKNTATNKTFLIKSKLVGAYNFENIMAAVAIGSYFEVDVSLIKEAIEAYTPSNNRSQIIKSSNNTIIMDAYNANPSSMEAAINNFALTK
jgi:UDP-N-acetylmuramoyl-tripeptide--D-alanyl-D-alanine ligase